MLVFFYFFYTIIKQDLTISRGLMRFFLHSKYERKKFVMNNNCYVKSNGEIKRILDEREANKLY
ncbi:hypothetical protein CpipJ_CPIJ008785 [Culex quinquefasciatus]|uniref:Uncharacterized protein n=1 Tax=Culex quinquefasciatus TaxID=7176 RepID=B0WP06_CULQU|nr:hypothetical protein CpipJ_CPIJ008785 [Culex quinquefasciatus]|eukprot:XP_001850440.1 hypothetical protein CpipJ_CPIJ008785 [Culex quinquefasciatus]